MPRNLLLVLFILFISITHCQVPETGSLQGKNVLIVWGGWPGHSPGEYAERMEAWAVEEGANVTVSESLDIYTDSAFMARQDLLLQYWTMGTITPEQERGLLRAVRNGLGFAGSHGGMGDSFRDNPEYQYMVGGQWVSHPGGIIDYSVQIRDKDDPVTEGVEDFEVHSEQYYMHIDPNVKVLATTQFTGDVNSWIDEAVMPVTWKKYYGNGRIFYTSLGHSPDVFDVPEVWTMLSRGAVWASESRYREKEEWMSPVYK